MRRVVRPELLDHLPGSSPWSVRSRTDLQWLNRLMGNARILTRAFEQHMDEETVRRRSLSICELGAGDGSLLLRLAQAWSALGVTADAELVDLHYLVTVETRRAFVELNWKATPVALDVMTWLERAPAARADVILANLFLHHFEKEALRQLLARVAARTELFIACEPRRSAFAWTASHFLWAVGCNAVTRHDAPVSIRAGFANGELSALWPAHEGWQLIERRGGWFTHCFIAKRCRV